MSLFKREGTPRDYRRSLLTLWLGVLALSRCPLQDPLKDGLEGFRGPIPIVVVSHVVFHSRLIHTEDEILLERTIPMLVLYKCNTTI
ncbi:unnamed protein product [Arctogadus glacialis]